APGSGQPAHTADHVRAATVRAASIQLPDFLNHAVVMARFYAEGLGRIRLDLPQATNHFIQAVRNYNDLAVGDADKLVGIRRLRILPGFFIDFAGKLTIELLYRARG